MNNYLLDHLDDITLPIPIPQHIWDTLSAQIMPYEDLPLTKRKQYLHNQLAIWAVNFYLATLCSMATFPPNIHQINPLLALVDDHADLDLPNLGRLDCRAVHKTQTGCDIPVDAQRDRIGYVIVRIDPTTHAVGILGFSPSVNHGRIELSDLQAPEAMLNHFDTLCSTVVQPTTQSVPCWFQQHFEAAIAQGWLTLDEVRQQILQDQPTPAYLGNDDRSTTEHNMAAIASIVQLLQSNTDPTTQESALKVLGEIGQGSPEATQILTQTLDITENDDLRWQAVLSLQKVEPSHPKAGVSRAKLINLGVQLNNQPVALIGTFVPGNGGATTVFFQIHSFNRRQPLPPGIELQLLDHPNTLLNSVTSRYTEQGEGMDESISILEHVSSPTTICIRVVADGESFDQHFAV